MLGTSAQYCDDALKVVQTLIPSHLVGTTGNADAAQNISRILKEANIFYGVVEFSAGTFHTRGLNRLFFSLIGLEMIRIFLFNLSGVWIGDFVPAIVGIFLSLRIHLFIPWVLAKTVNARKKLNSKNLVNYLEVPTHG